MNMFSCPKESNNNNKMMINSSISNNSSNTEEFSFPVISNSINPLSNFMLSSSSASSSSLWRISSRVYHHPEDYYEDHEEEKDNGYYYDNDDDYHMEVRSMCEEISPMANSRKESIASASFRSKEMEIEESMDYLWEDFNAYEEKNEVKVNRFGEELTVLKMARMGSRKPSSGSSKILVIGKFLKGLVSIRRSAHNKLLKPKF